MKTPQQNISDLKLLVETRQPQKRSSKKLQRKGRVPIIIYGSKIKNLCLSIRENDAIKYSKSTFENKIFTLSHEDKKIDGLKVLKKAITYDRVRRNPTHIDFFAPDMTQKVRVTVEIKFEGKAKGVREEGGVFSALRRNIEIECLPSEIPQFFEIDVTSLTLHEALHVHDLTIPKNIKLITKKEETLCLVSEIQEEVAAPVTSTEEEIKEGEKPAEDTTSDSESEKKETSKESSAASSDKKS